MEKKKKLAIAGIVAMGVMLASSITFTVAWYTGSSHLSVNNFNINFVDKALTVSSDNEVFKEALSNEDLMDVGLFAPVSSAFSSKWIENKDLTPKFSSSYSGEPSKLMNNTLEDTDTGDFYDAPQGFLSQPIYFKCSSNAIIGLDANETKIVANHSANAEIAKSLQKKYPGMSVEEITENLDAVEKSLRVSFLVLNDTGSEDYSDYAYYIVDPHKEGTTYYGGKLDNTGEEVYDYYNGKEVMYGDFTYDENKLVYDEAKSERILPEGKITCFNSGTEAGVRRLDVDKSIEAGGLNITSEKSIALENVESEFAISLKAGVSKKVYLSLYLEGWDLDNTQFTRYSRFSMNLSWKMLASLDVH